MVFAIRVFLQEHTLQCSVWSLYIVSYHKTQMMCEVLSSTCARPLFTTMKCFHPLKNHSYTSVELYHSLKTSQNVVDYRLIIVQKYVLYFVNLQLLAAILEYFIYGCYTV